MTRRRGRRRKKLLDELKDRRGYCHLKEEAVDSNMWRDRFGRGFEPVVRQTTGKNKSASPLEGSTFQQSHGFANEYLHLINNNKTIN